MNAAHIAFDKEEAKANVELRPLLLKAEQLLREANMRRARAAQAFGLLTTVWPAAPESLMDSNSNSCEIQMNQY